MKEEKNYIHRRVCLCRQCGGTGTADMMRELERDLKIEIIDL